MALPGSEFSSSAFVHLWTVTDAQVLQLTQSSLGDHKYKLSTIIVHMLLEVYMLFFLFVLPWDLLGAPQDARPASPTCLSLSGRC